MENFNSDKLNQFLSNLDINNLNEALSKEEKINLNEIKNQISTEQINGILNVKYDKKLLLKNKLEILHLESLLNEHYKLFYTVSEPEISKVSSDFLKDFSSLGKECLSNEIEILIYFTELSLIDNQEVQLLLAFTIIQKLFVSVMENKYEKNMFYSLSDIFFTNFNEFVFNNSAKTRISFIKLVPLILVNSNLNTLNQKMEFIIVLILNNVINNGEYNDSQIQRFDTIRSLINELFNEERLIKFNKEILNNIIFKSLNNTNNSKVVLEELLILTTNDHLFIKSTAVDLCFYILKFTNNESSNIIKEKYSSLFLSQKKICLGDFFPQIRYSSLSLLSLYFDIMKVRHKYNLMENDVYVKEVLPYVCLNRYFPAEGIKNSALSLWKSSVDMNGIKIIQQNFEAFLLVYIKELSNESYQAKEASIRTIQEMLMKVFSINDHYFILEKYYKSIFNAFKVLLSLKFINVRICSLNALGFILTLLTNFIYGEDIDITVHPDENNDYKKNFQEFIYIIYLHLFDFIYEVRDSAAYCLKELIEKNKALHFIQLETFNEKAILDIFLKNDEEINEFIEDINKQKENHKDFIGLSKTLDSWEYIDGIAHLIKELCDSKGFMPYFNLLSAYFSKKFSSVNPVLRRTIWLGVMNCIKKSSKSEVDFILEEVGDILLKEIESKFKM